MISFYCNPNDLQDVMDSLAGILQPSLEESNFIPFRTTKPKVYSISVDGYWELYINTENPEKTLCTISCNNCNLTLEGRLKSVKALVVLLNSITNISIDFKDNLAWN